MADNENIEERKPIEGENTGAAAPANAGENTNDEPAAVLSFEEQIKTWAAEKGRPIENIDDLFVPVEKIVEKEVNPYEDLLDEEDKAYFQYKRETGRGRDDYRSLKQNWDEAPALELARERVRKETGLSTWPNEKIDAYLESELGIDLEDIDDSVEIKLAKYVKPVRDEKKTEQQKYMQPAENKPQQPQPGNNEEQVELPGGAKMSKSAYEHAVAERQKFTENAKEGVNSVTASTFKVFFDDDGEKREKAYSYDYSDDDRSSAVSIVTDIDAEIRRRYQTEKGFNHTGFAEDMLWSNPKFREKAIATILQKQHADVIVEFLEQRGNVNFTSQKELQKTEMDGVKMLPPNEVFKFK